MQFLQYYVSILCDSVELQKGLCVKEPWKSSSSNLPVKRRHTFL